MYFIIICIVLAIAIYLHDTTKVRMRAAIANVPGPYCFPIIGCVQKIFDINQYNFIERYCVYSAKYGNIMRAWLFQRLAIMSFNHELSEQFLCGSQNTGKHRAYKLLIPWLGNGLLLSSGKKWFDRRKIITPAFHFKILEEFLLIFAQQANILLERLAEKADGCTAFNICPYVCAAALDVIAETAMGTKVYAQSDANNEYVNSVNAMLKIISWRFMRVFLHNEIMFSILRPDLKLRQMRCIKIMHEFTIKVIEERRSTLEKTFTNGTRTTENEVNDNFGAKKRMALLDILLQSSINGQPLSNEDIREEVDTFMFEGHDTTASTLGFVLYLISRNDRVQQKLYTELKPVFANNRIVTMADLNEMKYMDCVIRETLRLYPPVPIIAREIVEDFKYTHSKIGDGIIPAGAEMFISMQGIGQDEDIYSNTVDFEPERQENCEKNNFPFSAGPRNCIGQKFAMFEMKMMLGKVLSVYELLPFGQPIILELNIVLRSANGCQLGLRKRLLN